MPKQNKTLFTLEEFQTRVRMKRINNVILLLIIDNIQLGPSYPIHNNTPYSNLTSIRFVCCYHVFHARESILLGCKRQRYPSLKISSMVKGLRECKRRARRSQKRVQRTETDRKCFLCKAVDGCSLPKTISDCDGTYVRPTIFWNECCYLLPEGQFKSKFL